MQFPITIGLHRSRFIDLIVLLVALLASVAALYFPRSTPVLASILVLIWIIAGFSWWQLSPRLSAIRLERNGQILIAGHGQSEFISANLLPGATVHPWLTALGLRGEDGVVVTLIATVDSLKAEDFRRLRLFLRWRVELSAADDDA